MKRVYLLSAATAFVALAMTSCGGSAEAESVEPVTYTLDAEASKLEWKGDYADGTHSHNGTVKFSEATIVYEGEAFQSGNAKVDLSTIDSELDAASGESDLLGHFSSPAFFNSAAQPQVDVTIVTIADNTVTATLNIGGKKLETSFPANVKVTDDKVTIKGKFDVDFTSLDLAGFKADAAKEAESGKKDQYVKPIVHFDIDLVTKAPEAKK